MQEMMKAMMQGQGGDHLDMEEMQREIIGALMMRVRNSQRTILNRHDGTNGKWNGWSWRIRWTGRYAEHVRYVQDDGNGWTSIGHESVIDVSNTYCRSSLPFLISFSDQRFIAVKPLSYS